MNIKKLNEEIEKLTEAEDSIQPVYDELTHPEMDLDAVILIALKNCNAEFEHFVFVSIQQLCFLFVDSESKRAAKLLEFGMTPNFLAFPPRPCGRFNQPILREKYFRLNP